MLSLSPARRRAHRAEAFIRTYRFPPSIMRKVARTHPELRPADLAAVETGLREWLVCCAYRDGEQLGMPSAAVDWAWHEFILHTPAYHAFCRQAYGEYLHHVPEADMSVPMRAGLQATVRAWDRSQSGLDGTQPSLWELDAALGLEEPIGVPAVDRQAARHAPPPARRSAWNRDASGAAWVAGGHGGPPAGAGCGGG
ncbi:MAG TPA: hypothetical protein VN213_12645, partial [Solirubrobacteraceae bacterium]|nr:hypothetical protein [Solirubrobacteraceae bacterium]